MLSAVFALALAASPEASPSFLKKLEPAFKGTIVSTYKDGRKGHLNLSRDGTYRYRGRTNVASGGVWTPKGDDRICLKQKTPRSIPFSYCTAIPHGRTWNAKAAGGEPITLRVVSGRG